MDEIEKTLSDCHILRLSSKEHLDVLENRLEVPFYQVTIDQKEIEPQSTLHFFKLLQKNMKFILNN